MSTRINVHAKARKAKNYTQPHIDYPPLGDFKFPMSNLQSIYYILCANRDKYLYTYVSTVISQGPILTRLDSSAPHGYPALRSVFGAC